MLQFNATPVSKVCSLYPCESHFLVCWHCVMIIIDIKLWMNEWNVNCFMLFPTCVFQCQIVSIHLWGVFNLWWPYMLAKPVGLGKFIAYVASYTENLSVLWYDILYVTRLHLGYFTVVSLFLGTCWSQVSGRGWRCW